MNREEFIKSTGIIAAVSLSGNSLFGYSHYKKNNLIPIIDTHQHLWDINRFGDSWSKPPMNQSFDQFDYLRAIHGLNVVKAVYMEVAVPENKRYEEALYAIEMCQDTHNPTVAAVIAADPTKTNFIEYLTEFKNSPYIKGIRYFFKTEEEINRPLVKKNINLLSSLGLSFDFSVPTGWLPAMNNLIKECPQTRFLLNHCGNVDPRAFFSEAELKSENPDHDREEWLKDMRALAMQRNIVCKISGVATRAMNHTLTAINLAPSINACLDIFGPDRVMFASDWPVCLRKMELSTWVNILKEIVSKRSYSEQKKLFHDNAIKFYKI